MYLEYHSVCPLVGIGTPPAHNPAASELLPGTKGGGDSPAGEGGPNHNDRRKSLALCLLCWVTCLAEPGVGAWSPVGTAP
jgi:hypothetical protein